MSVSFVASLIWMMVSPHISVPIDIDRHGGVFVDVRINDSGPYRFIVDTGSSRSIVSETLARELRAPVVARSEVVTSTGSEWRMVVRLDSVLLSAVRQLHVLAVVVPDARASEFGPGVRGLLAQDFLSLFTYTLDYRHAQMRSAAPVSCDAPEAVPLAAAEGRFVLPRVEVGGEALRLVPDSGAEAPVLFHRGGSGETPTRIISVKVGQVRVKDLIAYCVERIDANADGLLPLHHFNEVTFAAGGGCLVVR
jgi:aspartyl protease